MKSERKETTKREGGERRNGGAAGDTGVSESAEGMIERRRGENRKIERGEKG